MDKNYKGPWAVYEGEEQFDKIDNNNIFQLDLPTVDFNIKNKDKYLQEMDPNFHIPKIKEDDGTFKPSFMFGVKTKEIILNKENTTTQKSNIRIP